VWVVRMLRVVCVGCVVQGVRLVQLVRVFSQVAGSGPSPCPECDTAVLCAGSIAYALAASRHALFVRAGSTAVG
jgi:hypothetical protein